MEKLSWGPEAGQVSFGVRWQSEAATALLILDDPKRRRASLAAALQIYPPLLAR